MQKGGQENADHSRMDEKERFMTIQQQASEMVFQLPENKVRQVIEYIKMLNLDIGKAEARKAENKSTYRPTGKKLAYRKAGVLAGGLRFISEDFDEPLEEFKEYM